MTEEDTGKKRGTGSVVPFSCLGAQRQIQERLEADLLFNFLSESVAFLVHPGFEAGKEVGP